VTMRRPNAFFVDACWQEAMPHVKLLLIVCPFALLLMRRRPIAPAMWVALLGVIYLIALSYSVLPFYRYALPVTVLLYWLCAMTLPWLISAFDFKPTVERIVLALSLAFVATLQGYRCYDYTQQFANDSRYALQAWADLNLPPGAMVASDEYTQLSASSGRYRVATRFAAAEFGDVTRLRQRGVTHVAVSSSTYERYLSRHTFGSPGHEQSFSRFARTYQSLLNDYPQVWLRRATYPMHTFSNPDIVVVKINEQTTR